MADYKTATINDNTVLIVPFDADIPLSEIIDEYNKNSLEAEIVIIDMLIYVGDRKNRFQFCKACNGVIEMKKLQTFNASEKILDLVYDILSTVSIGYIKRILSPKIRKKVLEKKQYLGI